MLQNDKYKKVKKNIKVLFRQKNLERALVFLLFLFLSFCFWALQAMQQVTDIYVDVPLDYKNQSELIVIEDTIPKFLKINIQDRGVALLAFTMNKEHKPIEIDLESLNADNNAFIVTEHFLKSECLKLLSPTTQLLSYSPQNIVINASLLKEKKVPVLLNGDIFPAAGYMLTDKIRFSPSEVTVYGPKDILDTLSGVYTEKIRQEDISRSQTLLANLATFGNIKTNVAAVNIVVKVEEYTEKTFEIPVTAEGFPENCRLRTFPASIQLSCSLPLSRYLTTTSSLFEAVVSYSDTMRDSTSMVSVTISKMPEGISNCRFSPEKVEYLIEQVQ